MVQRTDMPNLGEGDLINTETYTPYFIIQNQLLTSYYSMLSSYNIFINRRHAGKLTKTDYFTVLRAIHLFFLKFRENLNKFSKKSEEDEKELVFLFDTMRAYESGQSVKFNDVSLLVHVLVKYLDKSKLTDVFHKFKKESSGFSLME